jgi:hypothetical protein
MSRVPTALMREILNYRGAESYEGQTQTQNATQALTHRH